MAKVTIEAMGEAGCVAAQEIPMRDFPRRVWRAGGDISLLCLTCRHNHDGQCEAFQALTEEAELAPVG